MTRRMSWREADFKFHIPKAQNLSVSKINRRFGSGVNIEPKERASTSRAPKHMIVRMQRDQRQWIQRVRNRARAANMTEVCMCVPEMSDSPAAFLRSIQNDTAIPSRVDHHSLLRFRISDEIGVGLRGSKCE